MSDFRPEKLNLQLWRGDTWTQAFTITQNGSAYSLEGASVKIQIRKRPQSSDVILQIDGADITITGAGNNVITVTKLLAIDAGDYYWDLQVTFGSGMVKTFVWGKFKVNHDVTRP